MAPFLTNKQAQVLTLIAHSNLARSFYFSGGTALAYYYLKHRQSEDLDFFNFNEFNPQIISVALKSFKKELKYSSVDYQNSFNRNLYFLRFESDDTLKLEFTYYPFTQVEAPTKKDSLLIDSAIDIAVNKLFTISQNPRGRDYFDLYTLVKKYNYQLDKLRMLAKQKFDWHIDPLQLASRLNEVSHHLDDPIIEGEINQSQLTKFFKDQATSLESEIITK